MFPVALLAFKANVRRAGWLVLGLGLLLFLGALVLRDGPLAHYLWYIWPVARLWDFLLGIVLCLSLPALLARIHRHTVWQVGAVAAVGALILLGDLIPMSLRYDLAFALPFAALIVTLSSSQGRVARLLSHPWMVYLGDISFGFYMFHWLVINYMERAGVQASLPYLFPVIAFAVTLALSAAAHRYVELPATRAVRRRTAPSAA